MGVRPTPAIERTRRDGTRSIKRQSLTVITLLMAVSLLMRVAETDQLMTRFVFDASTGWWGWVNARPEPWTTLYDYGALPCWLLAAAGLVLVLRAAFIQRFDAFARSGLYLLLVVAVGPVLIVNGVLKNCWGRPRPYQLIEYGGTQEFVPVGSFGSQGTNGSFPSGHAAAAFSLIAPAFCLRDRHRLVSSLIAASGLAFGCLVGAARILQGGHFLSDVIWSAGIVYLVCLFCTRLLRLDTPVVVPPATTALSADDPCLTVAASNSRRGN